MTKIYNGNEMYKLIFDSGLIIEAISEAEMEEIVSEAEMHQKIEQNLSDAEMEIKELEAKLLLLSDAETEIAELEAKIEQLEEGCQKV